MTKLGSAPAMVVAGAILGGCVASQPALPPAPRGIMEITVQAPTNTTGRELVIDDPGTLGRYLGVTRSTVPEVLAADLRTLLADRGFRVVPGTTDYVPALRTEIRSWVPYSADYSQVTVSLVASLIDPEDGRTLWATEQRDWRVQTPHARSAPEASTFASLAIARALVDGWQPGSGTR